MSRRTKGRKELEERIGHSFAENALLDSALTHISALSGKSRANSYCFVQIYRRRSIVRGVRADSVGAIRAAHIQQRLRLE